MPARTRLAELHELEMKHQTHIHQADLIVRDEKARRLKLELIRLQDWNAELQERDSEKEHRIRDLTQRDNEKEGRIRTLAQRTERVVAEMDAARETLRAHERSTRAQEREAVRLKAQLKSLGDASTTCRSEKAALKQELDTLRPEVSLLRADRERVEEGKRAAESELEAERRARRREDGKAVGDLRRRLEEAETRLAAEKEAAERARRDAGQVVEDMEFRLGEAEGKLAASQQTRESVAKLETRLEQEAAEKVAAERKTAARALAEASAENEVLRERIEGLKARLASAQAELRTCRAELEAAHQQATLSAAAVVVVKARPGRKKRAASEAVDEEFTLQACTPADESKPRRHIKKKAAELSLLGEKSVFSVTPFLNKSRTLGGGGGDGGDDMALPAAEPSPCEKTARPAGEVAEPPDEPEERPAKPISRPRGRPQKLPLADAPSARKNMPPPATRLPPQAEKPAAAAAAAAPVRLELVVEEGESEEEEAVAETTLTTQENTDNSIKFAVAARAVSRPGLKVEGDQDDAAVPAIAAPAARKRRKLAGNTSKAVFDNEDEDDGSPSRNRPLLPPSGRVAAVGLSGPAGPNKVGKAMLGPAVSKAFAGKAFSPLKRDRRGMQASFLTGIP